MILYQYISIIMLISNYIITRMNWAFIEKQVFARLLLSESSRNYRFNIIPSLQANDIAAACDLVAGVVRAVPFDRVIAAYHDSFDKRSDLFPIRRQHRDRKRTETFTL